MLTSAGIGFRWCLLGELINNESQQLSHVNNIRIQQLMITELVFKLQSLAQIKSILGQTVRNKTLYLNCLRYICTDIDFLTVGFQCFRILST